MATIQETYSQPMDATQVLGNPDAQNTAQRGKNIADGLMDDYKDASNPDSNKIPSSKELDFVTKDLPASSGMQTTSSAYGRTPTGSPGKELSGISPDTLAKQRRDQDVYQASQYLAKKYNLSSADAKQMALDEYDNFQLSARQKVDQVKHNLTQQKETLASANTASQLREAGSQMLDPENMLTFGNNITEFTARNAHALGNEAVKKELSPWLESISKRHKDVEQSINSSLAAMGGKKYGITHYTADMIDPATGRFDYDRAKQAIDSARSDYEQREIALAGQKAEMGVESATKKMEAAARIKAESPAEIRATKMANLKAQAGLLAAKKDILNEFGGGIFDRPSFMADATGNKVEPNKATHVVWKTKDKKNPVIIKSIEDYQNARERLQNINENLSAISEDTGSSQQGKILDEDTAASIFEEAGGDSQKARDLARQRGYTF